ncbi:TonB-dependent receptor family protein [Candidatus Methylopumilus turicensis]|uniref:TonB-dependent receptor n=1 Tax=Candidatus Methylopumilus turicensis TaxID=1581680 RepID=A0A0B7J1R6_9PROT|nr:TonB-dependent receptor [Candidatus Methylopumilus turicensis]CEN56599.1 TonB-dependent receptor [Candidatus Methylopumilus turicensis]
MNKKLIFSLVAASLSTSALAEGKIILSPVVVTATKNAVNSFDLPVSIDVVDKSSIQDGQAQMVLSESLIRVPGITAQNRTQYSQDPQISTRGFGSRSAFGVRGLRIYVDGIPFSMPDGIGQPGNIDLNAVKSIEVMRGPFSSLYGSSSGGVIQLLTEDSPKTPLEVSGGYMFGSYGTQKETLRAAGSEGNFEYLVNYSKFETDGYRENSAANKEQLTAKMKFKLTDTTKVTVMANWMDMNAQDPLGLGRNATTDLPSAFATPKAVPGAAFRANTRVSRTNTQAGINLEQIINENNTLNLIAYGGQRDNLQFLSLSPTTTSGRASAIARDFWGTELRWTNKGELLSRPYTITSGLTYGRMEDARKDISATAGVMLDESSLTNVNRRETNIAYNFDQYVQGQLGLLDNLDIHAGVRHTKVNLKVEDNLVDASRAPYSGFNAKYRDSSGKVSYDKTTPVIGTVWKVNPQFNLYANYGKGFETPTLIEVAYATDTGSGPNLGLKPSTSDNYEIGAKAFVSDIARLNAAFFRTDTESEIVTSQSGTYAVYSNAGKTKRQGLELSADANLPHNFGLYGAYTYLDATFTSDYQSSGNTVKSGNKIPGTYRSQLYGEMSWKAPTVGFSTALEARYNSKVYVDDVNSDIAPSYTVFNVRAVLQQEVQKWRFSEYVRVENLFDKDYIGSVRVNDSNSRFFEAAPGRNYLMGVNATYRF